MNKSMLGVVVIIGFLFLTTSAEAEITFERTYGGTDEDCGFSVQETQDGGYIIAGETYSFGAGEYDFYLIKTDSLSNTVWTKTYGGIDGDLAYSVQETQDGGFIIAGKTVSFGAGWGDVYLIKTDSLGNVGIEEVSNSQLTISNYQLSVYPNPFTTSTTIYLPSIGHRAEGKKTSAKCPVPSEKAQITLNIYDVSGRLVKDFSLFTPHSSLISSVSWYGKDNSGNELQGGVCFIKLTSGNIISVKKLILVR